MLPIEQDIANIQTEILKQEELLNTVQLRKYELKREMVEIMEAVRKSEYLISKLKIEEKMAVRRFWAEKGR